MGWLVVVESLLHFAVPYAALASLRGRPRLVITASLVALLPDLDVFLHVHRYVTHSLILVLAVFIPLIIFSRRFKPNLLLVCYASLFALITHLLLDLFQGFTPLLWPVVESSIWIQASGFVHISSTPMVSMDMGVGWEQTAFHVFQSMDAPLFTSPGLVISLILILPSTLFWLRG